MLNSFFRSLLVILAGAAVLLPARALAEDESKPTAHSEEPTAEPADKESKEDPKAEPGEQPAGEPKPPQPGQVAPLGVWVKPEKEEPLPEIETPERPYFFLEDVDEDKVEAVDNTELLHPKRSGFVMLSTRDRKRLDRAIEAQRMRISRTRAEVREEYWEDPRGEPELRICSVNTGGYGLRGEVRKLLRGARSLTKNLRTRERSIVKAASTAKCDILALQNVVGRDLVTIREALEILGKKLTKEREDTEWESIVGETNNRFLRNAFLINTKRAAVGRFESFTATLLPRFDIFERPKFAHGPLEVEVTVKGQGDAETRRIVLLTMNLQERIAPRKPEPSLERMQMAEAIKQLGMLNQQKLNPLDPNMLFILGELSGDMRSPESYILEGRRQLPDFKQDGICALDEENKTRFTCKEKILRPAVFLPLNRQSWHGDFVYRKITNEDEEEVFARAYQLSTQARLKDKNQMIRQTSGIFTVQADIKHVWNLPWTPGDLKSGAIEVKTSVPDSPLVWAELNW
ncbi:MAG: hypothetical protein KDD66_13200 [Bdellovibrionales bacterium]|nr:hypothetical protein [Bdellovibrionales bacterium]